VIGIADLVHEDVVTKDHHLVARRPSPLTEEVDCSTLRLDRAPLANRRDCDPALAVREHLRSQIDDAGTAGGLTPNEVELVRFAAARSEQLRELADRSSNR
jgi:hypothetical protein